MARTKALSVGTFSERVRDYLPADAGIWESGPDGQPAEPVRLSGLRENTFYFFDAEALEALCCAIAELALEEARGSLLAVLHDFLDGEHHRECLAQLASTLDQVTLLGCGRSPRGLRGVGWLRDRRGASRPFRLILYAGGRRAAGVLGRRVAAHPARFVGFCSLHLGFVRHLHAQWTALARGDTTALRHFDRLQALDLAARELRRELDRQQVLVDRALRRWQLDAPRCRPGLLLSHLERGLARLHQWKERWPELMARPSAG